MMKKRNLFLAILFLSGITTVSFMSCDKDDDTPVENNCELTTEQQNGLLYMREEEKLARDVYNHLYTKWNLNIFKNIAKSEQMHMDLLLDEVDLCKFDDSVLPEDGKFNNSHIQDLYDSLIEKGEKSIVDALEVGATIEDVDIFDLDKFSSETEDKTLLDIYDNLNCGSRNHMRAFVSWLDKEGQSYTPQFITSEKYNSILTGDHEQCGN